MGCVLYGSYCVYYGASALQSGFFLLFWTQNILGRTEGMRKTKHLTLSLMLILIFGLETKGQTEWPLQHVDKKSGLSNSAINAIYMDHLDYVWFGTWDGLNRYDGDEIISYKPIAEDEHLP